MCNSNCCIKDIRWEGGKLQILQGGTWKDVPGEPDYSEPSEPPIEDMPSTPSNAISCQKANGLWEVIETFMDALVLSVTGTDTSPLNPYKDFQANYGASLKADNFQLWKFMADHYTDDPEIGTDWTANKEVVKADFICSAQDAIEKFILITDSDFAWLYAYDFDSPSAVLDNFMTDMLLVPEKVAWKESTSYHVYSQIGECDCVGSEPSPEIPEGFGVITGKLVMYEHRATAPDGFNLPADFINSTPQGVKIDEQTYETQLQGGGTRTLGMVFYVPVGVRFTNARFTRDYSGTIGGGRTFEGSIYLNDGELDAWEVYYEPTSAEVVVDAPAVVNDTPGISPARYFTFQTIIYGGTGADKFTYTNIRFDVAAADGSWTRLNVAPGTPFYMG